MRVARWMAVGVAAGVWGVALGCGPQYEPPFLTGNYIDPNNSYLQNMAYVLESYFPTPVGDGYDYERRITTFQQGLRQLAVDHGLDIEFARGSGRERITVQEGQAPHVVIYTGNNYYYDECNGEGFANHLTFVKHLMDAALPFEQTVTLLAARMRMVDSCNNFWLDLNEQYLDNPFAHYLAASRQFYRQEYAAAFSAFTALMETDNPWVAETAHYMRARIRHIQSQAQWDGYDSPAGTVDQALLAESRQLFDDYLARYPQGTYAESARNLGRRLAYLRGDRETLVRLTGEHMHAALADARQGYDEAKGLRVRAVFHEWQGRAAHSTPATEAAGEPLLQAHYLLQNWSEGGGDVGDIVLEAKSFAPYPGLYELLRAAQAYGRRDFVAVTQIKSAADAPRMIANGVTVLRARAFTAQGEPARALEEWLYLVKTTGGSDDDLLLGLAENYTALDNVEALGKKGHPINRYGYENRRTLFTLADAGMCDSDRLLAMANDEESVTEAREEATATLLDRYLVTGDFTAANEYLTALKVTGSYAAIQTALASLAKDPEDPKGLLNLAYFLNTSVTPMYEAPRLHSAAASCVAPEGVALHGPRYYYQRVVQLHGEALQSVDEQKALHYLVQCGREGERERSCMWGDVADGALDNQGYFKRLHQRYPGSAWAKKTPYYYE